MSTPEAYSFDMKRPIRTVALEPNFAKRSTRSFVCGGMAGNLVLHEKGWLGHKETILHAGEGPIWSVRWRGRLIAWANDLVSSKSDEQIVIHCRMFICRVSKSTTRHLSNASHISIDLLTAHEVTSSNAPSSGKTIPPSSSHGQITSKSPVSVRDHAIPQLQLQLTFRLYWLRSLLYSS